MEYITLLIKALYAVCFLYSMFNDTKTKVWVRVVGIMFFLDLYSKVFN